MIVWICKKCGCEAKESKPEECPICKRKNVEFLKKEKPGPDKEEQEYSKKYDEVIEKLEEYTESCEPEQAKYSVED